MRFQSYLRNAAEIVSSYTGEYPFAGHIKAFFAQHKKFGSTDRKLIQKLCYSFFRLGQALKEMPVAERIVTGLFLCSQEPNELLQQLKPEWNEQTALTPEDKLELAGGTYGADILRDVFPLKSALSEGVGVRSFRHSFFIQPDLFLRLRPGREAFTKQKLKEEGIPFEDKGNNCLALPNTSAVDKILALNKDVVIQDWSSQRVGSLLTGLEKTGDRPMNLWDCCAASGGKTIMAKDLLKNVHITVSDIRESIIHNLQERFKEAGITQYQAAVTDLLRPDSKIPVPRASCDLLIADVPCSGSGTWGRTPENLYYFDSGIVEEYSKKQKGISKRIFPYIAPGGYLLYITCSVFREENEAVVQYIQHHSPLKLIKMELLRGYEQKADTLFAALLRMPGQA